MDKIAVVGGAGFVGSFTARHLKNQDKEVFVIDDLSSGHRQAVGELEITRIDILAEKNRLISFFKQNQIDSVIHFAALIQVGESMKDPGLYFNHNVCGSLNIIEAAAKTGVKNFVFSSSAGVYGNPEKLPIPEEHPLHPTSVYGESKVMVEKILQWYWKVYNLPSVAIRYFNASGADFNGNFGEDHIPESHLIPKIIKSILNGKKLTIFGNDYNTPDGTTIRDYVHVEDLAEIHALSLELLEKSKGSFVFNAGTGKGYSNLEVVKEVEAVSGKKVNYVFGSRRTGDAERLVADNKSAQEMLSWTPRNSSLDKIVKSAWLWHSSHPQGYEE